MFLLEKLENTLFIRKFYMFCIKVSIKDKKTKPKESIALSLLPYLTKNKFFVKIGVSEVTRSKWK